MNRRTLLQHGFRALGAVVAAAVGVPALVLAVGPAWKARRKETWVPLGGLDDFPPGEMRKTIVELPPGVGARPLAERAVFARRTGPTELVVFSRNCTDLGCPITWDRGSEWFFCPCHGGIFSSDGERQAGPPARPLFRYAVRERDGVFEIDLDSVPPMT